MASARNVIPIWYRFSRGALRAGVELSGRRVRLLGADRIPQTAAIFVVCRPARLLDALILMAVCEGPIRCVVPHGLLRGFGRILGWGAGVVNYQEEGAGRQAALRACSEAVGAGEAVAVFAESGAADVPAHDVDLTPSIALEAWASVFPEQDPVILPVHTFWPAGRGDEILVHIGDPLNPDYDGGSASQEGEESALSAACLRNVFALDQDAFERLLRDVQEALLSRLKEEWDRRPGWKQKTEGFRLSAVAAGQLRRLNQIRPEDLAGLRSQFDTCRELRRRWSLTRMRADLGRQQLSSAQRALAWIETVVGLPLALWGVVNHATIALLLYALGLTQNVWQFHAGRWLARALVVLGCYAGLTALVGHLMGRAAAGYYAVMLPVSGVYLWRYAWLLRQRTRVLLFGPRARALHRLAEGRWKLFLAKLDAALTIPPEIAPGAPRS